MEPAVVSPTKKLKQLIATPPINVKTSVICTNVPEGLFEQNAAKKHFIKFGKVQRIRLFPKKQMCIVEYDQPIAVERALLNAGAFDGFMFDVTRNKPRMRRRSKKDDDPDWVPDADVKDELSALGHTPVYRLSRQKPMDIEAEFSKPKPIQRSIKQSPIRKQVMRPNISQNTTGTEFPVIAVTTSQTSLSTGEAASELNQLRSRVSTTPDEKWRTLDARDRILRAWGGAGSRVKVGGATIGTCPDMCPEKELLHRQAEHQVMTLETYPDSDGLLEPWRAVKQYSRSSADQEIPMCYELRPASVLMKTCNYLLQEVADTTRQVSLADWFHFMWDRFRSIRKDITQQALCCSESIQLVEMCARFHAHCAARLADLEHTQFDQKLNTDNLTKCLQTLKHMYADVGPENKPREAEFRGYIALLNLGDSNFWWEIKQLPIEIQKSEHITFAIKIFNALDNNNYVRFFRLVRDKATYLQACILLRYFNDVRARALARIVKAYAPRGGSRYPAEELMNSLAFESVESMLSFVAHYGLRLSKSEDSEVGVILDRNQFIEDSDPYPMSRAVFLIESKRKDTVGKVIAGDTIPTYNFSQTTLFTSFTKDGKLKETALIAEDLGYNTINDSKKDVKALKNEILRLINGSKNTINLQIAPKTVDFPKDNLFTKPEVKVSMGKSRNPFIAANDEKDGFLFTAAIPVAPIEIIQNTPEKIIASKPTFSFSKPQDSPEQEAGNIFKKTIANNIFHSESSNVKSKEVPPNLFKEKDSIFGTKPIETPKTVFNSKITNNIFANKNDEGKENNNVFSQTSADSIFKKTDQSKLPVGSIFGQVKPKESDSKSGTNIFGSKPDLIAGGSLFKKPDDMTQSHILSKVIPNGDATQKPTSPGALFKSATQNGADAKTYSIFQSKNKVPSVADNILNSVVTPKDSDVYDFNQNDEEIQMNHMIEEKMKQEAEQAKQQEIMRLEQERLLDLKRKEEERRKEQERIKQEELKRLEEKKRREEEEKRREVLCKKIEEQKIAEMKRKEAEDKRRLKEKVEKESEELITELCNEVTNENINDLVKSEIDWLNQLLRNAESNSSEILIELCDEICNLELKAEKFWTDKVSKKWISVWKRQVVKNVSRRNLLEGTPVWLTEKTPTEEASILRRSIENSTLMYMNKIHKGYRFSGEPQFLPAPEPYNIMEIIRSPLLKRMKVINYPYDKCFFWKVTLVSPGANKWLYRRIEIQEWIQDTFCDNKSHQTSETLISVGSYSWNNLIDFAISVSLVTNKSEHEYGEALEGSNGILFYDFDNNDHLFENIQRTLKHKYPYQIVPVAVILAENDNLEYINQLERYLQEKVHRNEMLAFKIFVVKKDSLSDSLYGVTKSALKWLAKKYPPLPPLEVDYLKSVCQRYLANEFWCKLRTERDTRVDYVLKDMPKLIKCYNTAVDKLAEVLTNEDLYNYPSFPLEFNRFLNNDSPYPKPYEFIQSSIKNSDNASSIKNIMKQIKLPNSSSQFHPMSAINMQEQIHNYCKQLGWFENSEEVACKVIALLPNELTGYNSTHSDFREQFEHYNLIDFLNIIVYEKISRIKHFDNLFAMYNKLEMENYRNLDWLYNVGIISNLKHRPLEYRDEIDYVILDAKRRKLDSESEKSYILENKDCTLVENNVKVLSENIIQLSNCKDAVEQLEKQIEAEKIKSLNLELLLQSALSDV